MSINKYICTGSATVIMLLAAIGGCTQKEIVIPEGMYPSYMEKEEGKIELPLTSSAEVFNEDNRVTVFASGNIGTNMEFLYSAESESISGEGTVSGLYCALYPYQANASATVDGNQFIVSTEIVSDQTAFNGLYLSAGKDATFLQACAIARIPVISTEREVNVTNVSLAPLGSENLAGTVSYMVAPGMVPLAIGTVGTKNMVSTTKTFTVGNDVKYVDFYVAPQSLVSGYKVTVTQDTEDISEMEFPEAVSLIAGNVVELKEFNEFKGMELPEFYIEYTAGSAIEMEGYQSEYKDGKGKIYFTNPAIPSNFMAENTDVTGIMIPSSMTEIGASAFFKCSSLTSVTFEQSSNLVMIGEKSFQDTSIAEISIPESVEILDVGCFNNTPLKTITFGNNSKLKKIEKNVFAGARSLENIFIPASLEYLGAAFNTKFNTKLVIHFLGTVPPTPSTENSNTFNKDYVEAIFVPTGCLDAYLNAWASMNGFNNIKKFIKEENL